MTPSFVQAMTDRQLERGCQELFSVVRVYTAHDTLAPSFILDTLELMVEEVQNRTIVPVEPQRLLGDINLSDTSQLFREATEQG